MITLDPALRRRHRADGCPETVLDELMKRLRDGFERRIYPDLFMGLVLNLDVEYAKDNTGTSLSHFVWEFPGSLQIHVEKSCSLREDSGHLGDQDEK